MSTKEIKKTLTAEEIDDLNDQIKYYKHDLYNSHGSNLNSAFNNISEVFSKIPHEDRDVFISHMAKGGEAEQGIDGVILVDQVCDDPTNTDKPQLKGSGVVKIAHFVIGNTVVTMGKIKPEILQYLKDKLTPAINNCQDVVQYYNLLNGRTEFIHNLISKGLLTLDDLMLLRKLVDGITKEHMTKCTEIDPWIIQNGHIDMNDPFIVDSMCVNLTRQYDYHPIHQHMCDLAAGLYITVDPDVIKNATTGGIFELLVPRSPTYRTGEVCDILRFVPRDGDFLIWKGNMFHDMLPTFKKTDRLMFTWNSYFNNPRAVKRR